MATKRKKAILIENVTAEQAQAALTLYLETDERHEGYLNLMNKRIEKVQTSFADDLIKCEEQKEAQFAILQSYATNNRDAFGDKKSLDFIGGKIGFRTGTPALKNLKGFTWESVTELLKKHLKAYVKITYATNKEKLLANRDNPKVNKHFEKCGITVAQGESFFVEPKMEALS